MWYGLYMSESGETPRLEREHSHEYELVDTILSRVRDIITSDASSLSADLSSVVSGLPTVESGNSELDDMVLSSAKYHINQIYKASIKDVLEDESSPFIVDANHSRSIKHYSESGMLLFLTYTCVDTSDGKSSRFASIILQDEAIRQNYSISLDRANNITATSDTGPHPDVVIGKLVSFANEDQMSVIAAVRKGRFDEANLDMAILSLRSIFIEHNESDEELDHLEAVLRQNHASEREASSFYDQVDTTRLSEPELQELIDFLYSPGATSNF